MSKEKIKQLQNNFTTSDQSKRLLELGVPADSADCIHIDIPTGHTRFLESKETVKYVKEMLRESYRFEVNVIPIWSVGRLIEIIRECATDFDVCKNLIETLIIPTTNNVDVLVRLISADEFRSSLDFSKLEE